MFAVAPAAARIAVQASFTEPYTFTAMRSEQANNIAQGAVLGALVSLPLMQWVRDLLFIEWVGCSGVGEKTQTFPDAINRPHFPSAVLRPGAAYTHTTLHTFGVSASAPAGEW